MSKRKIIRKITCSILTACIISGTLAACGTGSTDKNKEEIPKITNESVSNRFNSWFSFNMPIFGQQDLTEAAWQEPAQKLDASSVYSSLEYTPEMFWGKYRLDHKGDGYAADEPTKDFLDSCSWDNTKSYLGIDNKFEECSVMPYMFRAGSEETGERLAYAPGHDWCCLYFAVKHSDLSGDTYSFVEKEAAYKIVDNKISFMILDNWSFDSVTGELSYTFSGSVLTYDFAFDGPLLTFSNGSDKVDLMAEFFLNDSKQNFLLTGVCMEGMDKIDAIHSITISCKDKNLFLVSEDANGDGTDSINHKSCVGKLDDDGVFTFNYKDENGQVQVHQYVMFCCGENGLILTDGTKNYYYLSEFLQFEVSFYSDMEGINNIAEDDREEFQGLSTDEVEEILETRNDLLDDLKTEFASQGVMADIDPKTGEIVLASKILFDTGESDVSELGMNTLGSFINAFASVTSKEEYKGFISKVAVQGHTDTAGSYESNQVLSEARANTVLQCCLDAVTNPDDKARMENLLFAEGCSYDNPVYAADGTVDMDASRRVVFIFYIDLNYANN